MSTRSKRFDHLADIAPVIGPMGDDLLLRVIHASIARSYFPAASWDSFVGEDGRNAMEQAVYHGLALRERPGERGDITFAPTEFGLLYWESRGASFSSFIYQCPDVESLAYEASPPTSSVAITPVG